MEHLTVYISAEYFLQFDLDIDCHLLSVQSTYESRLVSTTYVFSISLPKSQTNLSTDFLLTKCKERGSIFVLTNGLTFCIQVIRV